MGTDIIELKEKYQLEYIVNTFDLYVLQSENIKSLKAWILKVLENQAIQREKQQNRGDTDLQKSSIIDPFIQEEYQKRLIILQKNLEIKELKEIISRDKEDKKSMKRRVVLNLEILLDSRI